MTSFSRCRTKQGFILVIGTKGLEILEAAQHLVDADERRLGKNKDWTADQAKIDTLWLAAYDQLAPIKFAVFAEPTGHSDVDDLTTGSLDTFAELAARSLTVNGTERGTERGLALVRSRFSGHGLPATPFGKRMEQRDLIAFAASYKADHRETAEIFGLSSQDYTDILTKAFLVSTS